jgi:hypothetical protein
VPVVLTTFANVWQVVQRVSRRVFPSATAAGLLLEEFDDVTVEEVFPEEQPAIIIALKITKRATIHIFRIFPLYISRYGKLILHP